VNRASCGALHPCFSWLSSGQWRWHALALSVWTSPSLRRNLHMGPEENDCGLQGDGGAPMAGSAGVALEAPAQRGGGDRAGSGDGRRMAVGKAVWGGISEQKIADLTRRIEALGLRAEDVHEEFICGSGRGGQAINKTASKVRFTHLPTGIQAVSQQVHARGCVQARMRVSRNHWRLSLLAVAGCTGVCDGGGGGTGARAIQEPLHRLALSRREARGA
jgi:hypothetical protein